MTKPKLILYGLNADPPHLGHLRVIEELQKKLCPQDFFIVMPTGQHPSGKSQNASRHDRFVMTQLLFRDLKNIAVDDFEIMRDKPAYTVETLQYLASRYPERELFFVMACDVANQFFSWHEPEQILDTARPIIVSRSDTEFSDRVLAQIKNKVEPLVIPIKGLDISSTQIRSALKASYQDPWVPPFGLSDEVLDYIEQHQLYR